MLICSVTPHGHRVAVYWDAKRALYGGETKSCFVEGLLNSLCFFPILSYGSTAPLAAVELPKNDLLSKTVEPLSESDSAFWKTEAEPLGLLRLNGGESDEEDCILKVGHLFISYLCCFRFVSDLRRNFVPFALLICAF